VWHSTSAGCVVHLLLGTNYDVWRCSLYYPNTMIVSCNIAQNTIPFLKFVYYPAYDWKNSMITKCMHKCSQFHKSVLEITFTSHTTIIKSGVSRLSEEQKEKGSTLSNSG